MAVREYIGARYVPRFTGLYNNTSDYEALDVVDDGNGKSYIAKIPTPAGTPLTNTNFWFLYGSANGAIINLQDQINDINDMLQESPFISVSMFGALGDGVTDDGDAIRAAIDHCNTTGQTLIFENKTYKYEFSSPQELKCSIDFNGATIILDSAGLVIDAFQIGEAANNITVTEAVITPTKVLDGRLFNKTFSLVTPVSGGLRWGSGTEYFYTRLIITDNDGNITNGKIEVPLIAGDYLCKNVRSINDEPITVENISAKCATGYTAGPCLFYIQQNNVEIKNVIIDYPDIINGTYNKGVISFACCSNCTVNNMAANNPYGTANSGYLIEISECYNIHISDFVGLDKSGKSWGSIGTNSSEFITYENCNTQRLDAHSTGNYTAKNCNLDWADFSGGFGNIIFNNCNFTFKHYDGSGLAFLGYRDDYMWLLSGNILMENCIFNNPSGSAKYILSIEMNRTATDADLMGYKGLNITVKDCYCDDNVVPFNYDIRDQKYASKLSYKFINTSMNAQGFFRKVSSAAQQMKEFIADGIINRNTGTFYIMYADMFGYMHIKNCDFSEDSGLEQATVSNTIFTIENCIIPSLVQRITGVLRVIDNLIINDVAMTGDGNPQYALKRGNIITAGTNTNIGSWNT